MSKVSKNNNTTDMHSHTEAAYKFIDEYLPTPYVDLVISKMKLKTSDPPTSSVIRNVRNKTSVRNDILLALVEVAKDNKESVEQIRFLTT